MNAVASMKLIYAGAGAHYLLSAGKADSLYRLSKSQNKSLAEWALNRIEFAQGIENTAISVYGQPLHSYLPKLHHDYEQDLKQNYFNQPQIDDATAIEYIYHDQIADEIAKLNKRMSIVIDCVK